MKPTYYLERSGGNWNGYWYCADEGRYYRRIWQSIGACEAWCKANDFRFVLITH